MQYDNIQKQFNDVIRYSQGIDNPNTDKLFEKWLQAKRDFIEVFGGKLIYEYPEKVSFELSSKEKQSRIKDFSDTVYNHWDNPELADFIDAQVEGFFSNQVVVEYPAPNGKIIPRGMKIVKSFKYFEKDEDTLADIQSAASMIIQEDKIEGKLCMSVHPLDFLSLSENTYNWRSCHALDGDYRAGNLSYMVDSSTVICYLKSDRDEKLPNFPPEVKWNSKKWRVLLFFSNDWDMIFAGRQYPLMTGTGLNFIKDKIFPKVFKINDLTDWTNKQIDSFKIDDKTIAHFRSPYIPVGEHLRPLSEIVINRPGSLQFNDLLSSTCYKSTYCIRHSEEDQFFTNFLMTKNSTVVEVGGSVPCCRCGKHHIQLSESFMCNDCEIKYGSAEGDEIAICPCCGNRFYYDDGYFVEGAGEVLCPDCAVEYTDTCDECGELCLKDELIFDGEKHICIYCKGARE